MVSLQDGERMSKRLSQVFLVNEEILKTIAELCSIRKDDIILEIGAGKGQLTKYLVQRAKKVIALEIDKSLLPFLANLGAEVVNEDILKYTPPRSVTLIVGNVPYHISGEIVEKVVRWKRRAVLLFQKEFAQRLVAKPGSKDYSRLTVLANYMTVPKILLRVNKNNFKPVPKVDSALVELVPRDNARYDKGFFDFVKIVFKHKNKTIRNALLLERKSWSKIDDKAKVRSLLSEFGNKKVFKHSIEEFVEEYKRFQYLFK